MDPSDATWDSVEPLVADVEVLDGGVEATFRCPRTGVTATGFGPLKAQGGGVSMVSGKLMGSVRDGIGRSVRRAVTGGVLPGGLGAAAYKATSKFTVPDAVRQHHEKRDAVVAAFATVADRFEWDDAAGTWVGRTDGAGAPAAGGPAPASTPAPAAAPSGPRTFASQLEAFPVATERDKGVLFRILAAVVAGDGDVGDHEQAVFAGMAPGADLASLLSLGLPGPFELAGVSSQGTKETVLLLAWSVAITDERLGAGESAVLDRVASGLGVDPAALAELRGIAQRHVLDEAGRALAAAGWTPEQAAGELATIAANIGVQT